MTCTKWNRSHNKKGVSLNGIGSTKRNALVKEMVFLKKKTLAKKNCFN